MQKNKNKRTTQKPILMNLLQGKGSGSQKKKQKKSKKRSTPKRKNKQNYVQDLMGIDMIKDGVIFQSDGGVSSLFEIIPINYYQKNITERNSIIESYEGLFRVCENNIHIKMRTEDANIEKIIRNVRECNKNETNPKVLDQIEDYINHIQFLQGGYSLCQKFYCIYDYEGDAAGKKSNEISKIIKTMRDQGTKLKARFANMGCLTIDSMHNPDFVYEVLYAFYNPNSSILESLESRAQRIQQDHDLYNASVSAEKRKDIYDADYVAPRGIDLTHPGYIIMDGQYHTYLSFRDNGYPPAAQAGWLDRIKMGSGIDIDLIFRKVNRNAAQSALAQYSRISFARANLARTNPEKFEELSEKANNAQYVSTKLKKYDEDLFDLMVVITLRSNSFEDLMSLKDQMVSEFKAESMYLNDCFLTTNQYFRLSSPMMLYDTGMFTSVFDRDKHNFLTSSAASTFIFTTYELFDESGFVMGTNNNGTLISINNFNTARYSNANMLIIGTSGAGKTFTEEMLGYRMRMTGIRTIFILPTKARVDYLSGCQNIGGSFITLAPQSPNTVNILDIRPAVEIDETDDEDTVTKISLLSRKISSVGVFVQLLMGPGAEMDISEETNLQSVIREMYKNFGITDDDDSIWKNKKKRIKKDMPTLQDLYDRTRQVIRLQRITDALSQCVTGNCPSLNGQTNVDLSNKYIVFDVDGTAMGKKLLPVFMYIAFDCAYSMAKESDENFDAIFLDEVWQMMINNACAEQVQEMVRLIRAYAGCVVLASQDIEEFLNQSRGFGRTVLNNTEIKLILKLKEIEADMVSDTMHFTQKDINTLTKLDHQALIYSNGDKVICNLIPSSKELDVFTTDANRKKKLKEKKKKQTRQANSKIAR